MTGPHLLRGKPKPVYLVQGSDPSLVSQALGALVDELSAGGGGFSPVEEHGEPGRDEPLALGPVLDACRTPPFLGDRRIVVVRAAGLEASQAKELAAYLDDPLGSTVLVVALSGRAAPAVLAKAVRAKGTVIEASPAGTGRARAEWLASHLRAAPVALDPAAARRVEEHLGEDLGRLEGLLAALAAAYGTDRRLGVADVEPFLGTAGAVAPWDLTDAIDRGDIPAALAALRRLVGGGERHPLQVLATLHRHYGAILRLDGADAADEQAAAVLTKLPPFPAKKALAQSRRLGHGRVARAVQLLAGADLDLRGRAGLSAETVLEVLVARLAQLARLPGSGRPAPGTGSAPTGHDAGRRGGGAAGRAARGGR
jgi:DNA polymerase-3 subunit delta